MRPIRVGQLSAAEQAKCPSSLQIRNGLDINNQELTPYASVQKITDKKGFTQLFFDDLKPGSKYDIFITSSSIQYYEPTLLWEDDEVLKMSFETLHNPNLMGSNELIEEFKKYKPGLGAAIERFLDRNKDKKENRGKSKKSK